MGILYIVRAMDSCFEALLVWHAATPSTTSAAAAAHAQDIQMAGPLATQAPRVRPGVPTDGVRQGGAIGRAVA